MMTSETIAILNPPSPAFIPPDRKTSKSKERYVKKELLFTFLTKYKEGNVDRVLMWAAFLTSHITPELDQYFKNLIVEFKL